MYPSNVHPFFILFLLIPFRGSVINYQRIRIPDNIKWTTFLKRGSVNLKFLGCVGKWPTMFLQVRREFHRRQVANAWLKCEIGHFSLTTSFNAILYPHKTNLVRHLEYIGSRTDVFDNLEDARSRMLSCATYP
ncbi:hypothetical protein AVEN_45873-1 [Araneus ventricosus]|uniref:Uncharacterized protein n=1 Tax=Araneus ventricosus TaxID=182803 RepID=A0A4Y2SAY0_ARAVE|nr:hypothetical protein AVEN_45873-1 [Araneus ventricosus]